MAAQAHKLPSVKFASYSPGLTLAASNRIQLKGCTPTFTSPTLYTFFQEKARNATSNVMSMLVPRLDLRYFQTHNECAKVH